MWSICITMLLLTASYGQQTSPSVPRVTTGGGSAVAESPVPYKIVLGDPELVLDTQGIVDSTDNLVREQHSPVKVGQVVKQDHPWEAGLYFYGSTVQTREVRTRENARMNIVASDTDCYPIKVYALERMPKVIHTFIIRIFLANCEFTLP